ncbi:hypothetical protein IWW34DRAFT_636784, partial [Fusarium oxysporum f. sp. albedinis]
IHTNKRPYACSISGCGKDFVLDYYQRIHTGTRLCKYTYNSYSKRHDEKLFINYTC